MRMRIRNMKTGEVFSFPSPSLSLIGKEEGVVVVRNGREEGLLGKEFQVERWTGLWDKNKRLVYEGDRVRGKIHIAFVDIDGLERKVEIEITGIVKFFPPFFDIDIENVKVHDPYMILPEGIEDSLEYPVLAQFDEFEVIEEEKNENNGAYSGES